MRVWTIRTGTGLSVACLLLLMVWPWNKKENGYIQVLPRAEFRNRKSLSVILEPAPIIPVLPLNHEVEEHKNIQNTPLGQANVNISVQNMRNINESAETTQDHQMTNTSDQASFISITHPAKNKTSNLQGKQNASVQLSPETLDPLINQTRVSQRQIQPTHSVGAHATAKDRVVAPARGKIILMSYMRSGSTFTGELFQFNPEIMYFYEPLLYTHDVDILTVDVRVRKRLIPKFAGEPNAPETLDFLLPLLNCNVTQHDTQFLVGHEFSRSMTNYTKCVKSPVNISTGLCFKTLLERCTSSKHIVSKVLRLKMWEVEQLLSRDLELKVIHIIRDPRGVAMSRRTANYYFQDSSFCKRVSNDAALSLKLQTKHPGRILTVRYEDLATNPLEMSKILYHFSNISWTEAIEKKILDITHAADPGFKEHIFGTRRKDSSATAFNWRHKLDFPTAASIQRFCTSMMEIYGYNKFENVNGMRDMSTSSLRPYYSPMLKKAQIHHDSLNGVLPTLEDMSVTRHGS